MQPVESFFAPLNSQDPKSGNSGAWGSEIFAGGIWNPECSSRSMEYGIQYLMKNDPESSSWKSGNHGAESRIQDCLGLPYMA